MASNLMRSMRKTLEKCPQFRDNAQLKAVFNNELLAPWRGYVREADNEIGRVNLVIDLLREEKHAETRMNVLFLFLLVLRDDTPPENDRYRQLDNLARDFNNSLQSTTTPHAPYSGEEANPDNQPMLFVEDFKELLKSVQSVGKVSVPQMNNGNMTGHQSSGTAWLIAPDLALTCLHVIEARTPLDKRIRDADRQEQATNSVLTFDYTVTGKGIGYQVKTLEGYDSALDYALVRLQDRIDYPLRKQGFLRLDVEAPLIPKTSGFYIIQHPKGQPQQVASGFYQQHLQDQKDRILHSAPTEKGTSGAPVLNTQNWSVVALHTSDNPTYRLREATLLSAILSHIQQIKASVYDEIIHAASER